jgi:TonB family protein
LSAAKAVAISAPFPDYPYLAKRAHITGSGVCVMLVDRRSGRVTRAMVEQSTGNAILDKITTDTFAEWRFKPRTVSQVQVPITYRWHQRRITNASGLALAWYRWPGKLLVETLVTLPLLLPPVATGLLLFSDRSGLSHFLHQYLGTVAFVCLKEWPSTFSTPVAKARQWSWKSKNFRSRSHDGVIRVYDAAGNVIETHEHKGDFKGLGEENRLLIQTAL